MLELLGQAASGNSDITTWVYGGSALALISVLVAAIVRVQRTYPRMYGEPIKLLQDALNDRNAEIDRLGDKIARLERGQRECDFVVDLLIRSLQEANIAVLLQRSGGGDVMATAAKAGRND